MSVVPIGTNSVTALARRFIAPSIADTVYKSNATFFRLNAMNKKQISGGTQIEYPLMVSRMASGGFYQGSNILTVTPSDTVVNAAWAWKQAYVPIVVDGLTRIRNNSPAAIAQYIDVQAAQSKMEMAEILGTGLWQDGIVNPLALDGISAIVDNGTDTSIYGGLSRAQYPALNAQVDSTTTALSLTAMQALVGSATFGGRHPTIGICDQKRWNEYIALNTSIQRFPTGPGGVDEQLAQAGFTNALFNNIPLLVDSHIPSTSMQMVFLNENYLTLHVAEGRDMYIEDFQTPVDQDAMVAKVLWAGNIICNNPQTNAKFTALV
jgi:hypothetical protein